MYVETQLSCVPFWQFQVFGKHLISRHYVCKNSVENFFDNFEFLTTILKPEIIIQVCSLNAVYFFDNFDFFGRQNKQTYYVEAHKITSKHNVQKCKE